MIKKINKMTTFWIEFKAPEGKELPFGTKRGCGITANDLDDAFILLKKHFFSEWDSIPVNNFFSNVSIDDLERNHIRPNIGNITRRGLWYPDLGE